MSAPTRREKANAIRVLSMDAVQKAKSGHPGAPMGMADIAEVLWCDHLSHNPGNPDWPNRDRFVLSNGHGSMLIYSLLHLTGYALSIEDLRNFRQLHAKTPGHPEYGYAPGVETTTGPLGQGISNAVGMALAEKTLAATFNMDGHAIVDHHTYVFLGDGCLMEGISHEACSLAGTLGLGKLIAIYDDNGISIDGKVAGWFTDDTPARFRAYGWQVIEAVDGHDPAAVSAAITAAREDGDRPSLICCRTEIGRGSPNKGGTASAHGAPLGEDEVALVREQLDWPHDPFVVPDAVYRVWDARETGAAAEQAWQEQFDRYRADHPEMADEFMRRTSGTLPKHWQSAAERMLRDAVERAESIPSRKASQNALEALGPELPELIGGSADLTGSNLTMWSGSRGVNEDPAGNYIYYGVREFGMAAIMNGLALHGGFRPYGATFLMFSEYARNALRMAALMKLPATFVFTHDSVGLGEDGPTHQPVEQLASLRLMPGMSIWRPCDAVESLVAWQQACESTDRPFCLVFSRQNLAHQERSDAQLADIRRGGYVLRSGGDTPEVTLIATGSEVGLAMQAAESLPDVAIRVVSLPSVDRFEAQDEAYRESVIPAAVSKRLVIEAGVTRGWEKYAGSEGLILGIDAFGESAPADDVFAHFGITLDGVVAAVHRLVG